MFVTSLLDVLWVCQLVFKNYERVGNLNHFQKQSGMRIEAAPRPRKKSSRVCTIISESVSKQLCECIEIEEKSNLRHSPSFFLKLDTTMHAYIRKAGLCGMVSISQSFVGSKFFLHHD